MTEAASPAPASPPSRFPDDFEARRAFAAGIPMFQTLGMELVASEAGRATVKLPVRDALLQPAGILHGGAIAALADSAVAQALVPTVEPGTQFTTIELKVNYVRPIAAGALWAECDLVHCGRRTALGDVTVRDDGGKLVAKCLATYMLIRPDD